MTTDLGRPVPTELKLTDLEDLPSEPAPGTMYKHKVRLIQSVRLVWRAREIIYTLTERDIRAQYKQANLGLLWTVLTPLLTLAVFVIMFTKVAHIGHGTEGLPATIFMFPGIMCWNYFSTSLVAGGNSLLSNKALLAKTQFPRECFPIDSMMTAALNTALSLIPLIGIFAINRFMPHIQVLWSPLFILIEVAFTAGVVFAVAGMVINMRDLVQVLPMIISLGLFLCPVVWPFHKIPLKYQPYYAFFIPVGVVINEVRRTMLHGLSPQWGLTSIAALGAALYLLVGYRIFKRLEVHFADLA